MRKGYKIAVWTVAIIVVLMAALLASVPMILSHMSTPDHAWGERPLPAAPDYRKREHWSAWPDQNSPAERLPQGISPTPQSERMADAFFLHPTTYGSKEHWVQPMDDEAARWGTDMGTTSIQASVFNGCCRVYVPRYRQHSVVSEMFPGVQEQIMNIGYTDVRAAFLHFIEEIGPQRPFVLGSHSQGTFHLPRLIAEEISGTPLRHRLVAAYAVGSSLPQALVEETMPDIELCTTATQTGCFISWDAHEADRSPSSWGDADGQGMWNGTNYEGFGKGPLICVNPISWTTGTQASDPKDHLGALPFGKSDELGAPLPPLVSATVSARCGRDDERNWLFVNGDRDPLLQYEFPWSLFLRNLHGSDYGLFWQDIRQNAIDRTQAFVEQADKDK